ncbi:MAG: hypothetical protein ACJ78U_17315 [Myxococcales bacterium]
MGKRATNAKYRGSIAATRVCWSITSLNQTRYGSRGSRLQGSGRRDALNQSSSALVAVLGNALGFIEEAGFARVASREGPQAATCNELGDS